MAGYSNLEFHTTDFLGTFPFYKCTATERGRLVCPYPVANPTEILGTKAPWWAKSGKNSRMARPLLNKGCKKKFRRLIVE